eukprot:GHVQ01006676.1.p1 GENE.GHVQ01006676.1~~GHVQ01006676.1.p1  ORF type:complete len:183 (+),score=28.25 GHVQ01006676.1:217-765(+)
MMTDSSSSYQLFVCLLSSYFSIVPLQPVLVDLSFTEWLGMVYAYVSICQRRGRRNRVCTDGERGEGECDDSRGRKDCVNTSDEEKSICSLWSSRSCCVGRSSSASVSASERVKRESVVCLSVRSGLDLFLQAKGFHRGSEVLIGAVNIPDVQSILRYYGLVPIPLDIEWDALSITDSEHTVY